jgi:hypothetical protein
VSVGGFNAGSATAEITVQLLRDGAPYSTATPVTWSVDSTANSGPVVSGYGNKKTGLAWGTTAATPPETELTSTTTSNTSTSDGTASIQLTDVMGQRTVAVQAKVTIAAQDYTVTQNVAFGAGPLAAFTGAPRGQGYWTAAATTCGGTYSLDPGAAGYQPATKLPTQAQLRDVSKGTGKGAAFAAGWDTVGTSTHYYWTGETGVDGGVVKAYFVGLDNGLDYWDLPEYYGNPVAVCLP